jgi:hypothetical protein
VRRKKKKKNKKKSECQSICNMWKVYTRPTYASDLRYSTLTGIEEPMIPNWVMDVLANIDPYPFIVSNERNLTVFPDSSMIQFLFFLSLLFE